MLGNKGGNGFRIGATNSSAEWNWPSDLSRILARTSPEWSRTRQERVNAVLGDNLQHQWTFDKGKVYGGGSDRNYILCINLSNNQKFLEEHVD